MNKEISNKSRIHTQYFTSSGEKVPGVTTVLNELAKPALIHWAWDLGIKGIDYREHRDDLAAIGTLTHHMILCHFKGEKPDTSEYSKKQIDRAENCLISFYEWIKYREIDPIFIEEKFISDKKRFGGTPDFYGVIDNELTLLDFKTGKAIYDEFWYQLAGYKIATLEGSESKIFMLKRFGCYKPSDIQKYRILRIGRDESEGFEDRVRTSLKHEEQIFLAALKIYHQKKKINYLKGTGKAKRRKK